MSRIERICFLCGRWDDARLMVALEPPDEKTMAQRIACLPCVRERCGLPRAFPNMGPESEQTDLDKRVAESMQHLLDAMRDFRDVMKEAAEGCCDFEAPADAFADVDRLIAAFEPHCREANRMAAISERLDQVESLMRKR